MRVKVGLDLGSTAIKAVLTEGERVLWRGRTATAPGQEELARRLMAEGLAALDLPPSAVAAVAVTGYGQKLFRGAWAALDEISANAAGLFNLSGGRARTVLNSGGQDMKALRLDERGRVVDFKMNDKCAAGTGRFFELAARLLDVPLEDFGALSRRAEAGLELNSTCAVFAESEMVSLLARGVGRAEIVRALHAAVARRAAGLLGRNFEGPLWLDGGPALNQGLTAALEEELLAAIESVAHPQYTVAFGAALSLGGETA